MVNFITQLIGEERLAQGGALKILNWSPISVMLYLGMCLRLATVNTEKYFLPFDGLLHETHQV